MNVVEPSELKLQSLMEVLDLFQCGVLDLVYPYRPEDEGFADSGSHKGTNIRTGAATVRAKVCHLSGKSAM